MKVGSGVRDSDGKTGVVIFSYHGFIDVLFEDMKVYQLTDEDVVKTGKYFDMSIIFDTIRE